MNLFRKSKILLAFILLTIAISCSSPNYVFIDENVKTGVDFSKGKWLINEIDCDVYNKEKLTKTTIDFFERQLHERAFYIKNQKGLLIASKTPLNPNKQKIKELKEGTGFDFFINIAVKNNKDEIGAVSLYSSGYSKEVNQSEVLLEIYDLNLQQIIYAKHIRGTVADDAEQSLFDTKKSSKLIDNIMFYKGSSKIALGGLKKIFKDLDKKSIK
jgi:hypothetical protein